MKIEDIAEYLKNNGIKPSYQRVRVFEYLIKNKNHPTVDMVFRALVGEIPTLSKTTVYNTLKLFAEKNIVIVINIEDNEIRYDADTSVHGHFKCEKCGKVYDFQFDEENLNIKTIEGFDFRQTHLYIKGICKNCKMNY
ncbi:MAG: transcriptional repressor [Bacteroidales bacterium]|nr:transcriptional repressor [Bacteroidales bacterium]